MGFLFDIFVEVSGAIGVPLTIALTLVVAAGVIFGCHWLTSFLAETAVSGGRIPEDEEEREADRESRAEAHRKRIEGMNRSQLESWLRDHPRDAVAVQFLCRRLRQAGEFDELVRVLEGFLARDPDLDPEAMSMFYHRLADILIDPLGQPNRARMALRTFAAKHPSTETATQALERARQLERLG
jgi:hypothetical protein